MDKIKLCMEFIIKQIRREVDRCIDTNIVIDGQKETLHDSLKFCMYLKFSKKKKKSKRKLLLY